MPIQQKYIKSNALDKALRSVAPNPDQIITPPLNSWLLQHANDQVPLDVWEKVSRAACSEPYDSSGRFGGSSAATCKRRQLLGYLGLPRSGATGIELASIFHDGTWRHLRWQTMLLMAGILDDIEIEIENDYYRVAGQLDGIGVVKIDHPNPMWRNKIFGWEHKGANPYVYDTLKETGWKKYERQIARYFLAEPALDLFVCTVENKATQRWKEWVVSRELFEDLIAADQDELEVLNTHLDDRRLPPMLSMCQKQTGSIWEECPFGGVGGACLKSQDWPRRKFYGKAQKNRSATKAST